MRRADEVEKDIREDLDVQGWNPGNEGYQILKGVDAFGWEGPSRKLVLETLSNAMDMVQDGDDWRDVELRIESEGAYYAETSLTVDEAIEMIGVLYNQGHEPNSWDSSSGEPLQAYLDAWLYELAEEVVQAFVEYLKEQAEVES